MGSTHETQKDYMLVGRPTINKMDYEGGGEREVQGDRPRFDLLMPDAVPYNSQLLTRIAIHMAKGAEKYSARNWEKFQGHEELERAQAALGRHFMQYMTDDDTDDEDHAAAIYFNIMAIEYIKGKIRGDW